MGKKTMVALFAAMLAVTACSSNGDGGSGNGSKENTAANTGSESSGDAGTTANEAVTYNFGRNMDPNNDNVAKLEKITGETLANNRWIQLFKEKLNIDVKYKMLSDSTSYDQKLKLAMASDDLPDMFQVASTSDLKQLMEAGALEEMGPLYDQYGSDLLKSIIEKETKRVFEPATQDGKIYAIPMKMPSTNGYNHLWIREDWLTKLGLERPKTMDDVHAIAKAFAAQDPDGNGKADTLGLEIDSDFRYNLQGLFWGYGAYPNPSNWIEKDGKVVRGVVQPEMKEPLQLLQTMFKEGLLDKEFGTKNNNKAMESVVAGKTGMFYGPHWMAFTLDKLRQNDPNAKWIVVPLPTKDGGPATIPLTISTDGYMVVKKGTKHPENLVKMFNVYVDALYGENAEFEKYGFGEGVDNIWQMAPVYTLDPMMDLEVHTQMKKAIADGTTDQLTGTAKSIYKNIQDGMWTMDMMFGPTNTPFEFVAASYPDHIMWNAYMGAPTSTEVTRGSTMDELIVTTLTSIIQGKTEVSAGFDKMVDEWNKLGGTKVTEEVNAALGK